MEDNCKRGKAYTPRERMLAAMSLQHPDRVPLMCQFSFGFMLQQLGVSPAAFWFEAEVFAKGLVKLCEMFHFDGILISLFGHRTDWKTVLNTLELTEQTETVYFKEKKIDFSRNDLPVVTFFEENIPNNISEILPEEIPDEIRYIPVSKDLRFDIDRSEPFKIIDLIYSKVGGKYSLHGEITSPFDYLLDLLGYEEALIALIENPEKCRAILQKHTEGLMKLAQEMCQKPIDAVKISSPFSGSGFISPGYYRSFVLPYESQIINICKEYGKSVYLHTCGSINDRLELMRDSGASGLECLDPPPIGDVELEDAFKRIGKDMFIKGNIDSVNTLLYGTVEKIEKDVKKRIETGQKGKGFILSTACSIAPGVKKERINILYDLVEKFGSFDKAPAGK